MTQLSRSRVFLSPAFGLAFLALPVAGALVVCTAARASDVLQLSAPDADALLEKSKPAIVQVRSSGNGIPNGGTGFFIDHQGTVLTSSSILGENTSAQVVINGVTMDAQILGNDPRSGLAMLRVNYGASPCLTIGSGSLLKSGEGVAAIGFPLSLPVALSQGPVSGFEASFVTLVNGGNPPKGNLGRVERFATTHIHANVAISPGEVGAPLLNQRGEVVGLIATSPDSGRSVFALPAEAINKVMGDFNKYQQARYGWVGVNVAEASDSSHDGRTVRVVQVVPGTKASESGMRSGDTVMRIDSREIYRPSDVLDASFFSQVGADMHVVVRREDKLYDYTFAIVERPTTTTAAPPIATAPAPTSGHVVTGK